MSPRFFVALLALLTLLAGCGHDAPQAALEAAVARLQNTLEAKQTTAVLDQLHPQFSAQQQSLDRDWAKRSMALVFLRYKNIRVLVLSEDSQLDPTYSQKAHTQARVALTGAEGLIPDSARQYQVDLEWWLEDGEWKLARLNWQ
ncbi:MAG: hypothetical protein ABWY06_24450 [Pseudomonas sp.]|uniref:hypothetical protein n=1 Tax=Pseudomonas sp. TaxID=306 RepID=UPI0033946EA8